MTPHHLRAARREPGEVVDHPVVAEPPGPPFVGAHAEADLAAADLVRTAGGLALGLFGDRGGECFPGGAHAGVARPGLRGALQAGRKMDELDRVLVLVAMLTASARAGKPARADILAAQHRAFVGTVVEHRDGDIAAMHPAAPFGRGNALDAVAADFVAEAGKGREFERRCALDAAELVQSAVPIEQADIGCGQILNEQAAIVAAFAGADFNDHGRSRDVRGGSWAAGAATSAFAQEEKPGHGAPMPAESVPVQQALRTHDFGAPARRSQQNMRDSFSRRTNLAPRIT